MFHSECINEWFKISHTCPTCRGIDDIAKKLHEQKQRNEHKIDDNKDVDNIYSTDPLLMPLLMPAQQPHYMTRFQQGLYDDILLNNMVRQLAPRINEPRVDTNAPYTRHQREIDEANIREEIKRQLLDERRVIEEMRRQMYASF
jgi:hypothetical protein